MAGPSSKPTNSHSHLPPLMLVDIHGTMDLDALLPPEALVKPKNSGVFIADDSGSFGTSIAPADLEIMTKQVLAQFDHFNLQRNVAKARTGDEPSIANVHARIDAGLFDTNLATFANVPDLTAAKVRASQESLFEAFFGAYGEVRFREAFGEPGYPTFPVPLLVTMPHGAPAFAPVLSRVFEALVALDATMEGRGFEDRLGKDRLELFAKAMAMACTMGMPEAIGPLAARCPEAVRHGLWNGDSSIGAWNDHVPLRMTYFATPSFFALQYGHPECLDALRAAGLERQFSFVIARPSGTNDMNPVAQHDFFSSFGLAILPSQLPAFLDRVEHRIAGSKNPLLQAIDAEALPHIPSSLRTFLPVFFDHGTMDKIPLVDVLKRGCERNVAEVVDRFKDNAPWDQMDSRLIVDVALTTNGRIEDGALASLLRVAYAQGQSHMFAPYESEVMQQADPTNQYQPQEDFAVSVTEPAYSVIKAGMKETLVLLMQNGLKPDEKDAFGTSPMDVARQTRMPDMKHVMKTFIARKTVMGVLDEIEGMGAETSTRKNTKPSP